jgi:hypothetical protein
MVRLLTTADRGGLIGIPPTCSAVLSASHYMGGRAAKENPADLFGGWFGFSLHAFKSSHICAHCVRGKLPKRTHVSARLPESFDPGTDNAIVALVPHQFLSRVHQRNDYVTWRKRRMQSHRNVDVVRNEGYFLDEEPLP